MFNKIFSMTDDNIVLIKKQKDTKNKIGPKMVPISRKKDNYFGTYYTK